MKELDDVLKFQNFVDEFRVPIRTVEEDCRACAGKSMVNMMEEYETADRLKEAARRVFLEKYFGRLLVRESGGLADPRGGFYIGMRRASECLFEIKDGSCYAVLVDLDGVPRTAVAMSYFKYYNELKYLYRLGYGFSNVMELEELGLL